MSTKIVVAILGVALICCCWQSVCLGDDPSPSRAAEAGSRGPAILTKAAPVTPQEMAGYSRLQEMANQKELLDSSVASADTVELLAAYALSFSLFAAAIAGTVFLAMM